MWSKLNVFNLNDLNFLVPLRNTEIKSINSPLLRQAFWRRNSPLLRLGRFRISSTSMSSIFGWESSTLSPGTGTLDSISMASVAILRVQPWDHVCPLLEYLRNRLTVRCWKSLHTTTGSKNHSNFGYNRFWGIPFASRRIKEKFNGWNYWSWDSERGGYHNPIRGDDIVEYRHLLRECSLYLFPPVSRW